MKSSMGRRKLNKVVYEEVRKQLEPLFRDFYASSPQYRAYFQARKQILERLDRANAIMKAFVDLKAFLSERIMPPPRSSPRFFCILNALSYLFNIELHGNFYVNLALLLLIGKGHALHLEPDYKHRYVRHAVSLKDKKSHQLYLCQQNLTSSNRMDFFSSENGLILNCATR